jgi:uncharacterized protein YndB with AHSA1/START domain
MARNEAIIDAPPERVFEVLMDPDSYGDWVVGSKEIRGADADWPAVGSRFHHRVGFGPFTLDDHTQIEEIDPPRLLKLRARARPLGTALVTLELRPSGAGTALTMIEDPADPLTAFAFQPVVHLLTRRRNDEGLRRLRRLAEGLPSGRAGSGGARGDSDSKDEVAT